MMYNFIKYIRTTVDCDLLDQIIVVLKVRQAFIQYPMIIEQNRRCYNLFSSPEKVVSILPPKEGISVEELSHYITSIKNVSELEQLIIETCSYYCARFRRAPVTSSTDFILNFLIKNDQKTSYLLNPYFQNITHNKKFTKLQKYHECIHQTVFTKRRLSIADISFHNPSFTNDSSFDICEINTDEIEPFFDDVDIGQSLIKVMEESKGKPKEPIYFKTPGGQKVQSVFYPYENFFEVCIFDTAKPSDDMRGTSKYIRPDNFVFLIKNIPLYSWFIGCQGEMPVAKGWQFVRVDRASPIFFQKDLAHDKSILRRVSHPDLTSIPPAPQITRRQSNPIIKKPNLEVENSLLGEGFLPFIKHDKRIFIAPYKGCNLDIFKKNGGNIDFDFLNNLNNFLLNTIESVNFEKVHDIKPQNILFASNKRIFSLIDYKKDRITPLFCRFQCHKIDRYDPEYSKKISIHTSADNVVMTTFYLLNNNSVETGKFYQQFFSAYVSSKLTHDFYKYFKETVLDVTGVSL